MQSAPRAHEAPTDVAAAAEWFRDLSRVLKTSRLYRPDNPIAVQGRERLAHALADGLGRFGAWTFHFTPSEIRLADQVVVRPAAEGTPAGLVEQLAFLIYRDGIREITFLPGIPRSDVDSFVDALALGWTSRTAADDMVTALWQANPTHVRIEALPLEQTLYLSTEAAPDRETSRGLGLSYGLAPDAREIRADLQQAAGPVGLHRDARDVEPAPSTYVDVQDAYEALLPRRDEESARLHAEWECENAEDVGARARRLLLRMVAADPGEEMHAAAAHLAVTWMASAIELSAWEEARAALDTGREIDPEGTRAQKELAETLAAIADEKLGDSLDEAEPERQARFFGFLVGLGPPGVPLALAVLGGATQPRTRAAACTALSYLCPDQPGLLAPALADSRPALVRSVVTVLGQIGGPEIASLLAQAARHPDPSVQREAATALPAVPAAERAEILLEMLASPDPRLLPALLRVARLERDPRVARALLALIEAPQGEPRGEEGAVALFQALADVGGEDVVPELQAMLLRGGWFTRGGTRRVGAAHTLARIGGDRARRALEEGLRSRSSAVRAACREAIERREAA